MDLALGTDWDLALSASGDVQTVDGIEAIRQHLICRLRFFLGEWFLDERDGVPYWERVLVHNPDEATIGEALRRTILGTPGVSALASFSLTIDRQARSLALVFEAVTTEGVVTSADLADYSYGAFAGAFAFGFGG